MGCSGVAMPRSSRCNLNSRNIYKSSSTEYPYCRRLPAPVLQRRRRKSLACLSNMTPAKGYKTKR